MQFHKQIFIMLLAVILPITVFFLLQNYFHEQELLLDKIDARLLTSARLARHIVGVNYHDTLVNAESIDDNTYLKMIDRYNRICIENELQYLWSLMEVDGRIVFTSSTTLDKDVKSGKHALFFDVHSNPEAYTEAFDSMEVTYRLNKDKWGFVRVALVPFYDANKRKYLFGAGIQVTGVREQQFVLLKKLLLLVGILCAAVIAISLWISRRMTQPLVMIKNAAEQIAEGNDAVITYEKGPSEVKSLAKSINHMLMTLHERSVALDESHQHLSKNIQILNQAQKIAHIGHFDYDVIKRSLRWSDEVYRIFGQAPDRFTPSNEAYFEMIHPEDRAFVEEEYAKSLEANTSFDFETRILLQDGTIKHIQTKGRNDYDSSGNPIHTVGMILDITERKQAEQALHVLNEELERRVSQRTAELEAANRDLKEFAYVVSHDLKAPLRGINQLAQWLKEDYSDVLDTQGQEQFELLRERVKRMDCLIGGVLRYSRAAHGNKREESIDLNTLVSQVIDMLASLPNITIRIEDPLPVILGDPIQVTQVFQNLLSNAVKFMGTAPGEISVGCVDTGETWSFRVEDNGPGIEQRHHERIFQIFQTNTPPDDRESTGIGLAVVKKIVELYGGRVWVESTPGQGSRFYFTWPKRAKGLE